MSDWDNLVEPARAALEALIRKGDVEADRIEELEAENKRLNEQMDAIEEMGTESLNALPDCLMRLAPALVENDELKAKLAKAEEALELALELADNGLVDFSKYGLSCDADINKHYRTTLAELKGEQDE